MRLSQEGSAPVMELDACWWRVPVIAIVSLRIFNGVIWLTGAMGKHPGNDWGWFPEWLGKEAEYATIPAYKWFLETIVIPNITFFGWMQFITELVLGIALIFGILTPLMAVGATLWAFNISLGSWPVPGEIWYNLVLFVQIPFVVAVTRSGRAWGVDAYLRPKLLAHKSPLIRKIGKWCT